MSIDNIASLTASANINNLKTHVQILEGLRHGWDNYDALNERAAYVEKFFRALDLSVSNQTFSFHDKNYRNIIADKDATSNGSDALLVGAHYDAAPGSPGADDNASGVAVLLETARILHNVPMSRKIRFVAFTLEEPQHQTVHFLIGSRHFAEEAKRTGDNYKAVLILESVGYASHEKGSQIIPSFVKINAPDIGNFLAIVSNHKSEPLMIALQETANEHVPDLPIGSYKAPFSGYLMPETRFSDHSPFWDHGYSALMLTDTAMFRNPYYHTEHDKADTLDFNFMLKVTKTVISFVSKIAGGYT
jgi:Zn-dependent M28 family amino/carboxypeptidase